MTSINPYIERLKYDILRRAISDKHEKKPYTKKDVQKIAYELERKSIEELSEIQR